MEDWAWVSIDMSDIIAGRLLRMLVEKWVKIRGFCFAHSWLELYEQEAKKTLQRSKGLRKILISIIILSYNILCIHCKTYITLLITMIILLHIILS